MEEETKFHWSEGMKFVSEGVKLLFVLNGAATISILTFIGNTKASSLQLIYAMACFALGAATGPIAFGLAYLTELNHGNASQTDGKRDTITKFHYGAYAAVAFGIIAFLLGIIFAGCGLISSLPNE